MSKFAYKSETCSKTVFPNPNWRHTNTACILCLPNQTHLIQLISSLTHLIMSWWVESGVFDKRDNTRSIGVPPGTGLGNTDNMTINCWVPMKCDSSVMLGW